MITEKTLNSKELVGKTVVSKNGKKFGNVQDLIVDSATGEILYIVLKNATAYAGTFELKKDEFGNLLIPFTSVISIGDFVIIDEVDLAEV